MANCKTGISWLYSLPFHLLRDFQDCIPNLPVLPIAQSQPSTSLGLLVEHINPNKKANKHRYNAITQ